MCGYHIGQSRSRGQNIVLIISYLIKSSELFAFALPHRCNSSWSYSMVYKFNFNRKWLWHTRVNSDIQQLLSVINYTARSFKFPHMILTHQVFCLFALLLFRNSSYFLKPFLVTQNSQDRYCLVFTQHTNNF